MAAICISKLYAYYTLSVDSTALFYYYFIFLRRVCVCQFFKSNFVPTYWIIWFKRLAKFGIIFLLMPTLKGKICVQFFFVYKVHF